MPPTQTWILAVARCPQLNPKLLGICISRSRNRLTWVGTDARETVENGLCGQRAPTLPPPPPAASRPSGPPIAQTLRRDTQLLTYFGKNSWRGNSTVPVAGEPPQACRAGEQVSIPGARAPRSPAELSTDCRTAAGAVSQSQDGRHAARFSARSFQNSGEERQPPLRLLPPATAREEDRREAGAVTMGMGEADGGAVAGSLPQAGNGSSRAHHTAEPI